MKNVLIRCDASVKIGLGHITRCLELARQLQKQKFHIIFAIKPYPLSIEIIEEKGFDYSCANKENFDYELWIKTLIKNYSIDIFIGDIRDNFPLQLIHFMKEKNILTIALDEPSSYAKECDLSFYPPHANIDCLQYTGKVYQGFEYLLLREEFYQSFDKTPNSIPNILVMMGGTDSYNRTFDIINTLEQSQENFTVTIILNQNNSQYDKNNNFIKNTKHKMTINQKVDNMSLFLNSIDFAITAFGTIIYELISKNIPAITITQKDDLKDINQQFFIEYGYIQTNNLTNENISQLLQKKGTTNKNNCKIIDIILKEIL
jgi:spore coat polysaccharide biosynthesis predicted glycosyltransferase SpsG